MCPQVIVGTFVIDAKKDTLAGMKGDASFPQVPIPSWWDVGLISNNGNFGSRFMIQPRTVQLTASPATDWRCGGDAKGTGSCELGVIVYFF